jgi:hypothetical protein
MEGNGPGDATSAASPGTPETVEQQLAKERDARVLMRDRLRNTEALAAESHALRARMAQELERVTAERDRLRNAAASGTGPEAASATTGSAASARAPTMTGAPASVPPIAPPMTPHASDWPLRSPPPPRRNGPWLALMMLTGLAVGVAGLAWITGSMPGENSLASILAPAVTAPVVAEAAKATPPAASSVLAAAAPMPAPSLPGGVVALPPPSPEAVLAAAPTAAGNASNPPFAALPGRLRAALDAEGVVAPVDIDAATGRVDVSDPAADNALRDRTDMIIRAVYAGASLPEPQIEHRWLSPPRAGRVASAALPVAEAPVPMAAVKTVAHATPAYAVEHARHAELLADAPEARPILPAGRVTAACKAEAAGRSTAHRAAEVSACMKYSCCSSANRQTEECRAYNKAYAFTCSAG